MPSNDVVLLEQLLAAGRGSAPEHLSDDAYFELFTFEQVLKDFDLSNEELLEGQVGGPDDGGLDGFFILIDGEALAEDTDLKSARRNLDLTVLLLQSKRTQSFSEKAIDAATIAIRDLLDLGRPLDDFKGVYSDDVLARVRLFREALADLAVKHPRITVSFVYATQGVVNDIHPKVRKKAEGLERIVGELFSGATARFTFLGARELLERARQQRTYALGLNFAEGPISATNSYLVLVNLAEYFKFMTDEAGALRKYLFEWNVRDYQGDVEVNTDIMGTLEDASSPEFWWLNNGVTIIASDASIAGKTLTLDDVQIVNGLQTSMQIFRHMSERNAPADTRSLLCRVIVAQDPATRDRIIKATNFQTAVTKASLKATDQVQRDIEDFFLAHQWYYDRRKNYHRNLGKPADRIITIPYLAQSVAAMALGEPDNARARPTSLMKDAEGYDRVFSASTSLQVYLWCALTMKQVETYMKADAQWWWTREFRFHIASCAAAIKVGRRPEKPSDLDRMCRARGSTIRTSRAPWTY